MRGHTWSCGHRSLFTTIIAYLILRFDFHYFEWTRHCALAAFDTVGVEIAALLSTAFVGRDLHGAHSGAVLTF